MDYYDSIFRRKSFHIFRETTPLPQEELDSLQAFMATVKKLDDRQNVAWRIVSAGETSCKCGAEYCILFYGEKTELGLQNVGYMGEQIDLYCTGQSIGTLWLGLGKTKEASYKGLDFIIMMAFSKVSADQFRTDLFQAKRAAVEAMWHGETLGVAEIARFAPSACNSQPWFVEHEGGKLSVYRQKKPPQKGLIPMALLQYFNSIDMGIFMLILEVCLDHAGIAYTAAHFPEQDRGKLLLTAEYTL